MRYLPHTKEDIAAMLQTVGARDLEDLFSHIPETCCCRAPMDLPAPLSEWELNTHMQGLSDAMAVSPGYQVFLGAGRYPHHIPEAVSALLGRSEFVTAYTPYQPEMSQGTLQAIYEYQTLTARLLGMEVANASLYDGASALAEAILMAVRIKRRSKIALSELIHPFYRQVVQTYLEPTGTELIPLPHQADGSTDITALKKTGDLAAVAVQSPNFFGVIEDVQAITDAAHTADALCVAAFTEPLAFGLFKNPGSQGADIACGEGQSLGIPPAFGGPGLGMFASRMQFVRNMPGRLVGKTVDQEGKRGFVLTLATREQHIRREKATSNICTNQSLCALAAAMYMAALGGTGFGKLARLNYDKAEYLKKRLQESGFKIPFSGPTFNEFVLKAPPGFDQTYEKLLDKKIIAGLPLKDYYPDLDDHYLICVTETKRKQDLDRFVEAIQAAQ